MNNLEALIRIDMIEARLGRTIKTGEFENCRVDLKIGGAILSQKDVSEISSELFKQLDRQVSEQLNRVVNGHQDIVPEPGNKPTPVSNSSGNNGKFTTEKQKKKIWALCYNNGLEKDEIVQQLEERFGTSDIVHKVSRADASDYIEELQMATV